VAETNLGRENYETITLWVLELNRQARAFYAKAGYSFDGTKKMLCIGGHEVMEYRYARKAE
jgi:RimJ/RimL family protein N-acetyltransferase